MPAELSREVTDCSVSNITSLNFCAPVPFCTPEAAYFCSTSSTAVWISEVALATPAARGATSGNNSATSFSTGTAYSTAHFNPFSNPLPIVSNTLVKLIVTLPFSFWCQGRVSLDGRSRRARSSTQLQLCFRPTEPSQPAAPQPAASPESSCSY